MGTIILRKDGCNLGNLKKSKKIIAFSVVLLAALSCTVILLIKGFPSYSADAGGKAPSGTTPEQADESGDGSGLARNISTKPTGGSQGNADKDESSSAGGSGSSPIQKDDTNQDENDVRTLVEAFAGKLKMVSLAAPADVAAQNIEKYYSDYVTPELLARWKKDPENAPGRVVSSPWPERVDIFSTERIDKDNYSVSGEIIEVTSVELAKGGAAAKRPVTVKVQKANGRWLISDLTLGEYAQRGPVAYENTRYGFSFYLPETWKGYTIVEEEWKGTKDGKVAETGPQLLIRHPDWTQKDPRQDIPIMVFTQEQWNSLQKEEFSVSAAPIGPRKLGSNSVYVFALPARYNFAFPTGFEEVEQILKDNPLWPSNPSEKSPSSEGTNK